jgi:hypothetical protein
LESVSVPSQIPSNGESTSLVDTVDCSSALRKATGAGSRERVQIPDSEWKLAAHRHEILQGLLMLGAPKDEVRGTAMLLNVHIATVYREHCNPGEVIGEKPY